MSLINDALKKAQRQQTGGAPAPAPTESPVPGTLAPRVERREKPADFRSQMLVLGGVSGGLLIALIVGGFFWWRSSHPSEPAPHQQSAQVTSPSTPAAPQSTAANSAPVQPKTEPKVEPVKIEPATPAPAATSTAATGTPQFTLPLAPTAPAATAPATTTASTATAIQLPATEPIKPPAERPKVSPQTVKIIDAYRVTGIRASGDESKVLMNDRVYRIGDTVDIELGIKLTGVAQGALTFEDAKGAVYTRNF
jgi:hypothetical protein